jgi:uncharacterized membrane protein
VLLALFAAGAMLRFLLLAHQSFWYDETVSAALSKAPLWDIVTGKVHDLGNPPLHFVLLHLWGGLFGTSEAALRSLSALAAAISIPVLYDVARRLTGPAIAATATALFAFSPLQIYFAQEARTYTLVTLLVLTATNLLLRLVENPRRPALWVAYAVTTFLSMYAHYFAAFVILAQLVWVIAEHRADRALVGRMAAALVAAALMYMVWIPSFIAQATSKGNLARAADTWYLHVMSTPLVFGVGTTLLWKDTVTPLRVAAAGLAVVSFGVAAVAGARALEAQQRRAFVLAMGWLLFPVLLPLAVSLALFPFFYVRYALPATPAFCIVVAAGLRSLSPRLRVAATTGIAATCALSLFFFFTTLVKHDWRSAEAWVAAGARPGDVVAFDADIGETPFAYYGGADDTRIRLLPPPDGGGAHFYGVSPKHEPVHQVDAQLSAAPRVWFVYSDPKIGAGTYYPRLFGATFRLTDSRKFRGIEVSSYEPRVPRPAPAGPAVSTP